MDLIIDKQQQRRREKIGVVVFVAAILAIFMAVAGYIIIGHSFDLAASKVDEDVGRLDGYLTIVFEGNNTPIIKGEEISDKILRNATDLLNPNSSQVESEQNSISKQQQNKDIMTEAATISNVSKFYHDKFSTICKICINDFNAYPKGEILQRGNWRLGILNVADSIVAQAEIQYATNKTEKLASIINLQNQINNLKEKEKADLVIVVCSSDKIAKFVEKVDCIVATNVDTDIPENGKQINSCYIMRIPQTGMIAALTVTPAKMISAKVLNTVEIQK